MKRAHARLWIWFGTLREFAGHMLLGVTVVLLSTLAFFYVYRNDLLILASQRRNLPAVKTLVLVGASAAAATEIFPESAMISYLHSLQSSANAPEAPELVEILLSAGASVVEHTIGGWTPLMLAASAGNVGAVEALLKHGSELDARAVGGEQTEGMTALMAASLHGHAGVVRLLLERGANPQLRAQGGYSALVLAASKGFADCAEILIQKGATIPATLPQIAQRGGHAELAEHLRNARPKLRVDPVPRRPASFPEK